MAPKSDGGTRRLTLALPASTHEWLMAKGVDAPGAFSAFLEEQLKALDTSFAGRLLDATDYLEDPGEFARRRNNQESALVIVLAAHLDELVRELVKRGAIDDVFDMMKARAREHGAERTTGAIPQLLAMLISECQRMLGASPGVAGEAG
jgi:hypothetical protein